ncbi:uncharacterized protein LOC127873862 isoform X2 [Dreissena polymorpha]|uniref:Uncharacterized protein n=1 Tax=Dreissena polymorpha TaxID=45954 RepID=A0A9D4MJE5_DREPO|nr:uncharacterized protein LOC127873862 isoform X2 [Dreissena polymorpha]KAH3878133.1 hypothetical protein DPMN_002017 [Dreissena polymorpha]
MSEPRRSNSKNSQTSSGGGLSISNSNKIARSQPSEVQSRSQPSEVQSRSQPSEVQSRSQPSEVLSDSTAVKNTSGLKVLGQDGEFSEDILYQNDVPVLLMTKRPQPGSRPVSSGSRRTPTPTKQISLQAVKRREEKDEPLEEIDWNDFMEPVDINFNNFNRSSGKVVRTPNNDSDDDGNQFSLRAQALSLEEHEHMIHKREWDMMSALSSARVDESEADISRKLDAIELEREAIEQKNQTEEQDYQLRKSEHDWKVEDGKFTYRNEHFRDLSKRDQKDRISGTFIFDGTTPRAVQAGVREVTVGRKPDGAPQMSGKSTHHIDGPLQTAVGSQLSDVTQKEESGKKAEAAAESSSEEEEEGEAEEEEDLIGERGTAPTSLLMEFLSCMMQGDYQTAEKLCKMILIYEPENPEALSFFPLIQEKIKQDADESSEGSDSDDSGEDEEGSDDNDDDDDSDDDDNDDESDKDEESDEDRSDDDNQHVEGNPDSGIASANSD